MALQNSDLFLVNSNGQSYKVQRQNLSGLSDSNAIVLINDGGVSKQVKKSNWNKIPDNAWLLCNQGGQSYKISGANFKSALGTSTSAITGISVQDLRQGHRTHDYGSGGSNSEILPPYDIRVDETSNENDFDWGDENEEIVEVNAGTFAEGDLSPAAAQAFFDGTTYYVTPAGRGGNYGPMTINFNPPLPSDTDLAIFMYAGGATSFDRGVCASNQGGFFNINGTAIQGTLCANGFADGRRWLDLRGGAYGIPSFTSLSQMYGNAIDQHGGCHCIGGIRINGAVLNGWFFTTFTFQNNSNFGEFPPGTDVYQTNDPTKTGRVIRNFGNTLVICSQQNNWTNGQTITKA